MTRNSWPEKEIISSCRLLVVGDVMLDRYWLGAVERISPEAPVPILHVQDEQDKMGGAANVALNVRTLGGQVTLLCTVGVDEAAKCLRQLLQEHDVNAVLNEDPSWQTIVKLRVIGRNQQLLRIDFEREPDGAALAQMLVNFERELIKHDVVLFSDYGKGGLAQIDQMIKLARAVGKPVVVDPKGSNYARYAGANVITPNRAELMQVVGRWSGESDLENKAQQLRERLGLEALLLTRSEEGMSLYQANQVSHVKAQVREVADVTGAGDTAIAVLALMIACEVSLHDAMEVANRAGGLVVGKFGTSTLGYEELFG